MTHPTSHLRIVTRLLHLIAWTLMAILILAGCGGQGGDGTGAGAGGPDQPAGAEQQSKESGGQGGDLASKPFAELAVLKDGRKWAVIEQAARKEGRVLMYAQLRPQELQPLLDAFKQRYAIEVEIWRADSDKVYQRTSTEYKAGRHEVDVMESANYYLEALRREGVLHPYWTEEMEIYPSEPLRDAGYGLTTWQVINTVAYNTNAVKKEELPSKWEDLLDPRWQGRLGIDSGDVKWMAMLVKDMGEEKGLAFFEELAKQKPAMHDGHTTLLELVIAGQVPMGITVYNYRAEAEKAKGAPVEWFALEPGVSLSVNAGLAAKAPHPNAGLLWIRFLTSKEGQTMLRDSGRIPGHPEVEANPPSLRSFRILPVEPVVMLDELEKWQQKWDELFMNR